jgi:hypothetical protein
MPARRTHESPRRVRLQPAFVLTAIPDAVFGTEHPAPPFVVEHGEVANGDPEGARLQISHAPFFDEELVAGLRFGEGIDGHGREYGWAE